MEEQQGNKDLRVREEPQGLVEREEKEDPQDKVRLISITEAVFIMFKFRRSKWSCLHTLGQEDMSCH